MKDENDLTKSYYIDRFANWQLHNRKELIAQ